MEACSRIVRYGVRREDGSPRADSVQKDREALYAFCEKIDEEQEEAKAASRYPDFGNASAAVKMHYFNQVGIFPSCTIALKELFEKMSADFNLLITGDPGCAKSFNVILIFLFLHSHGHPSQTSGLLCNQKVHAQSAYDNAEKAMRLYERTMEIKGSDYPGEWPFLLFTGDEIKGNKEFGKLKLILYTAATADDAGSLGALQPLIASALNDEAHENDHHSMIRASYQNGVGMKPFIESSWCMDAWGNVLNKACGDFELAMIPSTGSVSATMNRAQAAAVESLIDRVHLKPNDTGMTQARLVIPVHLDELEAVKYHKTNKNNGRYIPGETQAASDIDVILRMVIRDFLGRLKPSLNHFTANNVCTPSNMHLDKWSKEQVINARQEGTGVLVFPPGSTGDQ